MVAHDFVPDDHADVLIIGAGAAGGVAALRLADAGFTVVCLEQGDWPDRAAYPGSTPEWELVAAKQWSSLPSVRNGPGDYPVDLDDSDLGIINFNGVGGGTVLYAGQWPRMLPADFRVRSTDVARRRLADRLRRHPALLPTDGTAVRGVRPRRQPDVPAGRGPPTTRAADRTRGSPRRPRPRPPGVALVAAVQRHPVRTVRGPPCVRTARHVRFRLQRRRQGLNRSDPLAPRRRARRPGVDGRTRPAHRHRQSGPGLGRGVGRPRRSRPLPDRRRGPVRGERHRVGPPAPRLGGGRAPRRAGELLRSRGSAPHAAPDGDRDRPVRPTAGGLARPRRGIDPEPRVRGHRPEPWLPPRGDVGTELGRWSHAGGVLPTRWSRVGTGPSSSRPRTPGAQRDVGDPLRGPSRGGQPRRALCIRV